MSQIKNLQIGEVQDFVQGIFTENLHKKRQFSLADAALGLMNSDSLRIQLGENARKYAIENFDIEKVVKNHEEEFLKLLTI